MASIISTISVHRTKRDELHSSIKSCETMFVVSHHMSHLKSEERINVFIIYEYTILQKNACISRDEIR